MNQIRAVQQRNESELQLGLAGTTASWHYEKDSLSPWVFVGGLSSKLSEGDVIAVFSQVGEIEEMNFQRDARTGKPKGFAFIKFEDARSSILAIDNFNSFKILGRHLHVDHAVNPRSGNPSSK